MKPEKTRSLHETLLHRFLTKIVTQEWPPGFQLPFETNLAEEYGVSRMTMNKVLSELTRQGYLVRRRKLGTFVAQPKAQSAIMEISDIEAEVRALGLEHRFTLTAQRLRPPTPDERRRAIIADGDVGEVLALEGVHFAGATPFCLEERIINPQMAPAALDVDFNHEVPGSWLLRQIPWTLGRHTISAINADREVARNLGLALGEACLRVTRRTEISDTWVTLVSQIYPGESHQIVSQFTPPGEDGRRAE